MKPRTVPLLVAVVLLATLSAFSTSIVSVRATTAPSLSQYICSFCPTLSYPTTQHWKVGVLNNDPSDTIYAQVNITGAGSLGDNFQVSSGVLAPILHGHASNNNNLYFQETASMRGETFTFSVDIQWGLSSASLAYDAPQSCGSAFVCDKSSFRVL